MFDISPAQIRVNAAMSKTLGHEKVKMFWCDIFTPKALASLLEQTHPKVIDISNIQEWAPVDEILGKVTPRLSQKLLIKMLTYYKDIQYIVFSSPYPESGYKTTSVFIELLHQYKWVVTEKRIEGSTKIIYIATRN